MASEMVERVAKAIWDSDPSGFPYCYDRLSPSDKEEPLLWARAAIEAMREPTPAMVDAADPHGLIRANFEDAWRAMVDEALK